MIATYVQDIVFDPVGKVQRLEISQASDGDYWSPVPKFDFGVMNMQFRVISLPPFRAVSSGVDKNFDFSENGVLGRFDTYFSKLQSKPQDSFTNGAYHHAAGSD